MPPVETDVDDVIAWYVRQSYWVGFAHRCQRRQAAFGDAKRFRPAIRCRDAEGGPYDVDRLQVTVYGQDDRALGANRGSGNEFILEVQQMLVMRYLASFDFVAMAVTKVAIVIQIA